MPILKKQNGKFNVKGGLIGGFLRNMPLRDPKPAVVGYALSRKARLPYSNTGISSGSQVANTGGNNRNIANLFAETAYADAPSTGTNSYDYSSQTTTQAPSGSPTMGFSQGLMEILKRANTSYAQAQDRLRAQRQGFDIQATNEANDFFNNPVLSANVATQMGNNAGEAYRPLTTGIEGQMAYNKDIFDTVNNQVGMYMDNYNKEMDRTGSGGNELLSVSELEKFGLPYGSTQADAMGMFVGGGTGDVKATTDQLQLLRRSLENAKALANASGRSGVRRNLDEKIFGASKFTNLVAETNTLRTNIMTLMTDPTIKKFFGPQMSNADVQLMTSAGTTLNPELQKPKNMKAELSRLEDLLNRMEQSVNQGSGGQQGGTWQSSSGNSYVIPSFSSAGNASASKIAMAIRDVESGGNYNVRGGSGEFGAYQFMPSTWKQWAGQYLGNPNAQPTPQNQDYVAMRKITDLQKQGYNPAQIALIWNGGSPKVKRGVNKYGVKYDSGAYAQKVMSRLA